MKPGDLVHVDSPGINPLCGRIGIILEYPAKVHEPEFSHHAQILVEGKKYNLPDYWLKVIE